MRTAEGQGEKKKCDAAFKGLAGESGFGSFPTPHPGSTLYHRRGPPLAPP